MTMKLTEFESAALEAALAGEHPALDALREQLTGLTVSKRELTGVGFFADFAVANGSRHAFRFPPRMAISDVELTHQGLPAGGGIILFVGDGMLTLLEGFSNSESWPDPINYSFYYRDPSRRKLFHELDELRGSGGGRR